MKQKLIIVELNSPMYALKTVNGSIDKIAPIVQKMSEAAKSTIEKFDINVIGGKWMALFDDLSDRC